MTTIRNGTGINEPSGASNLEQKFEQKFDTMKEKAKDLVEQGSEKVGQLKHRVVEVKDQAIAKGNAFLDSATAMIKANPIKSVMIAFGVGYIGMRIFRR